MLLVFCAMHMFTQMTNFNPIGVVFLWGAIKEKEGIIDLILITLNSLFPGMFNVFNPNSHSLIFPTIWSTYCFKIFHWLAYSIFMIFSAHLYLKPLGTSPPHHTPSQQNPTCPVSPPSARAWNLDPPAAGSSSIGLPHLAQIPSSPMAPINDIGPLFSSLGPDSTRLPTGSLPSSSISVRSKLAPHKNHVLPPPELCWSQQPRHAPLKLRNFDYNNVYSFVPYFCSLLLFRYMFLSSHTLYF